MPYIVMGSSVITVTDDSEFGFSRGVRNFLFSTASIFALSLWLLSVTFLRRKAYHSPVSSTDVRNAWICTSTSPYAFMVS